MGNFKKGRKCCLSLYCYDLVLPYNLFKINHGSYIFFFLLRKGTAAPLLPFFPYFSRCMKYGTLLPVIAILSVMIYNAFFPLKVGSLGITRPNIVRIRSSCSVLKVIKEELREGNGNGKCWSVICSGCICIFIRTHESFVYTHECLPS